MKIMLEMSRFQAQNVQQVWKSCSKVRDVDRLTP